MSHRNAMFQHTKKRMLERYGIVYTAKIRDHIIDQILKGKAEKETKGGDRIWRVVLKDKSKVLAVYDAELSEVVTVMPYGNYKKIRKRQRKPNKKLTNPGNRKKRGPKKKAR